jgi:uridine phosphorylase
MMGVDSEDILIHPGRGRKEQMLPDQAILVVNPAEASVAQDEMRRHGAESRFLYNSHLLVDKRFRLCLAGPSLGAPAAGLVLEKLIALGVSRICLFSCCGAVNEKLVIGDLLVAVSGVSGEGVSRYYEGGESVAVCPDETDNLRVFLNDQRLSWQEGGIWSTDAPYRESRTQLNRLHRKFGIDGVDMEFTALCSIAAFRKVHLSALFVVSDELWGAQWKPGFSGIAFKKRCKSLISNLILDKMQEGEKND